MQTRLTIAAAVIVLVGRADITVHAFQPPSWLTSSPSHLRSKAKQQTNNACPFPLQATGSAGQHDSGRFDADEDGQDGGAILQMSMIWSTAGASAAKALPACPSPDLSAEEVATTIIRGLQFNDTPRPNAGLERCYKFMDLKCIKMVTGHGNVPEERTLEKFLQYAAESAKIQPFLNTNPTTVQIGKVNEIPAGQTRGELASVVVTVVADDNAPTTMMDARSAQGDPNKRPGRLSQRKLQAGSGGNDEAPTNVSPRYTHGRRIMIRMEKQRRPPDMGSYMLTEMFDIASVDSISRPLNLE